MKEGDIVEIISNKPKKLRKIRRLLGTLLNINGAYRLVRIHEDNTTIDLLENEIRFYKAKNMGIEEELELVGSPIPELQLESDKDAYLGDFTCWSDKVIFFKCYDHFYFYEGWEMFISDCTRVTIDELMKRNAQLKFKLNKLKKLASSL